MKGIEMGPNLKLRRPFIWQDEMLEVRQLFRQVYRIHKSGFTGFSTWKNPPPSADTLSRNRLRRRRALCSVELSHLNYKEAPLESLNHLQNIRGMCTHIQRQDYPMERKKKDIDLISRPPLLRRPVISVSVEKRGRKRPPFEVARPYSAPTISISNINSGSTPNCGPIPLQYTTPKLTTLYDITQKSRSTSQSSIHNSFNVLQSAFECPSTTFSKLHVANNCHNQCCTLASEENLLKASKSKGDIEVYGQIDLGSNPEMSNGEDNQSFTKSLKSLKKNTNITPQTTINGIDYCMSQISNLESNERSTTSAYCGWSTIDDMTTSSDIYYTSTLNHRPWTCDLSSSSQDNHITSSFKGIEGEKSSFIQPISDYCSVLNEATKKKNRSKSNSRHSSLSKTPLFKKLVLENSKAYDYHDYLYKMTSIPPLGVSNIDINTRKALEMKRGHNATIGLYEMNLKNINFKDDLIKNRSSCLNNIEKFIEKKTSNYSIALDSTSNSTCSMLSENLGHVGQTNTLTTTESRWLTTTPLKSPDTAPLHLELKKIGNDLFDIETIDNEKVTSQDTSVVVGDDPSVLIKHSSDPYNDFRLSMITMIEEEGLQDRQAELEELFQYYLDLNPKVHHDVLHKVIQDIQTKYLLKNIF